MEQQALLVDSNPQNSACSVVTHRRDMTLICSLLREVWGGGKGEGKVPSVRASTQPDTTVGTVRFCTLYTKVFFRSKSRLCLFYILVWYLLCLLITLKYQLRFNVDQSNKLPNFKKIGSLNKFL